MGHGEKQFSDMLRHYESQYRGNVCGYAGFDPDLEREMMAACDILLMPSRYEPCGLPQMYCQAYGTVPVVSATGGLCDSVQTWRRARRTSSGRPASSSRPSRTTTS